MPPIEDGMRRHISETLPEALGTAIASYQLFLEHDIPYEAKEFKAHHDACKVAIAHIELLIKLAQWADLTKETDNPAILNMIEKAESEIQEHDRKRQ